MKLLPTPPRVSPHSGVIGQGIEAGLVVVLLFGLGYALDSWLGTAPVFMIVMTVLAGVGFFAKFKYQYEARMEHLEAERAALARGVPEQIEQRS